MNAAKAYKEMMAGREPSSVNESKGGYVESMHIDDRDLNALITAWKRWKNGPETKASDVAPAKEDLLKFLASKLQ